MDFDRTEDVAIQPHFFWSLIASTAIETDSAQHILNVVRIPKLPRI